MDAISLVLKQDFLQKQEILENAKKVLKQEFIGIDRIINEVVDNISSWYYLPILQEKPVIINLWGLTGVGKTSLIYRLVELIDFQDSFYRFDLGEKEGSFSFRDSLDDLCENNDTSPVVIALDEIQNSRTVTGPFRQEVENDKNRMIWELIDSGRIQYIEWKRGLWSFEEMIIKLHHLLKAGVEVHNGVVVKNIQLFCDEMGKTYKEDEKVLFVPEDEYDMIIEYAGEKLGLHLKQDVQKILLSFSANETLVFLFKVLKIGKRPSIKNFNKALIFVLGNLDEAYTMSDNFSADIDADEFNKLSLKITVPTIKKALKARFRNEQIARLGNIHIIYPALSRVFYQKIIANELEKYRLGLIETFKIMVEFDHSINEVIYSEGVYPTQGVRPIFTSIHQILKGKLSFFYSELLKRSTIVDKMKIKAIDRNLICEYFKNDERVFIKELDLILTLEDVRQNKKDDLQAITAVHESGHAVLAIVLLKTIPEVIYSITTDANNKGFVYSNFAWKYVSRKEIIPRVAMMLGGYAAEELIFGSDNVTNGASTDIEKATEFLSEMYKSCGMGLSQIKYGLPINEESDTFHHFSEIESEIKNVITEAKVLAMSVLKQEMKLLLSLSDYLSDNRMLSKNEIKTIVLKTMARKIEFIENGDSIYYRNKLKEQVNEIQTTLPVKSFFENTITLNSNQQ